jgi:uncharacterized protein YbjT (DUF2867 family)
MQPILVTGATGHTGSLIVKQLRNRGVPVRALVRDRERAADLNRMGLETVLGDLDDPATLAPAVEGVERIYLVTWNGPTAERQRENVVDAARRVGRPHIVVGGALGPRSRIVEQIRAANDHLKASGLPWTILEPTFFMQNILAARESIAQGQLYWDLGDGRLPAIDIRDIADSAVAVLTSEGHVGQTYALTGPSAISAHDMASVLSKELEHEVQYIPIPTEAAREFMVGLGYPEWVTDGFGELMAGFADDWAAERTSDGVKRLTGHAPRSFRDFVQDAKPYLMS